MSNPSAAEQALRDGDVTRALKLLTEQVRAKPQDAKLRVFMFQLLCVLGQWDRALNQLNVSLELDPGTLPMVQTYREAINCETLRLQVFAGQKVPMLFGEPETWVALLIEALLREGRGEPEDARKLRAQAMEDAPTSAGDIDGQAFAWIADADTRLGPTLEAVINGRYYWLPWNRLAKVEIDRRRICVTASGCGAFRFRQRRRSRRPDPDTLPRYRSRRGRSAGAGAQHRLARSRARRLRRPGPAPARHRCGRVSR